MGQREGDQGETEGGGPRKCSGCGKSILNGHGNQRQKKVRVERFCWKCWEKRCEEKW